MITIQRFQLFTLAFLSFACRGTAPASGDGGTEADVISCIPARCEDVGATCGEIADGCGGIVQCGTCSTGNCGAGGTPNVCGEGTCRPTSCEDALAECGQRSDGCSRVLNCGDCETGTCGGGGRANRCGTGCVPRTCVGAEGMCGSISDGCGGSINCGCLAPSVCGANDMPNVCGCPAQTCESLGIECGTMLTTCGVQLTCGECENGTCGGGGTPGICGAPCSGCPTGFTCNARGDCAGGDPTSLVLNVDASSVAVMGRITINGAVPTVVGCSGDNTAADVTFINTETAQEHELAIYCRNSAWTWSSDWLAEPLSAGTYDIYVTFQNPLSVAAPLYRNILVRDNLRISTDVPSLELNVDLRAVTVSGQVTVNSAVPSVINCVTGFDAARVSFVNTVTSEESEVQILCSNVGWTFSTASLEAPLFAGTYDIYVEFAAELTAPVPLYQRQLVRNDFAIADSQQNLALNLNFTPATVAGRVTINSQTPIVSGCSGNTVAARIHFVSEASSERTLEIFCRNAAWTFTTDWLEGTLFSGTYDIYVELTNPLSVVAPLYRRQLVRDNLQITGSLADLTLNLTATPVTISGRVTVNNTTPVVQSCAGVAGHIFLTNVATNDETEIDIACSNTTWTFSSAALPQPVFSGTYNVYVEFTATQTSPVRLYRRIAVRQNVAINASTNLDLNVDMVPVTISGRLSVNGQTPVTVSCVSNAARVFFVNRETGDETEVSIACGNTAWTFTSAGDTEPLFSGTYNVYAELTSQLTTPARLYRRLLLRSDLAVTDDVSNLNLNMLFTPITVAGRVTVNGALPVAQSCSGTAATVYLVNTETAEEAEIDIPCGTTQWTFSTSGFDVPLFSGRYQIYVEFQSALTAPVTRYRRYLTATLQL